MDTSTPTEQPKAQRKIKVKALAGSSYVISLEEQHKLGVGT